MPRFCRPLGASALLIQSIYTFHKSVAETGVSIAGSRARRAAKVIASGKIAYLGGRRAHRYSPSPWNLSDRSGSGVPLRYQAANAAPCVQVTVKEDEKVESTPDADVGWQVFYHSGKIYRLI